MTSFDAVVYILCWLAAGLLVAVAGIIAWEVTEGVEFALAGSGTLSGHGRKAVTGSVGKATMTRKGGSSE